LRYAYEFSDPGINDALSRLLGLPQVHVAHPRQIANALTWHKHGMDFSDALHLSASNAQDLFFTFNRQFEKKAKQLNLTPRVQTS